MSYGSLSHWEQGGMDEIHLFGIPCGRVARAFDLAGITNTVVASFLRVFCEGPALSLSKGREWPGLLILRALPTQWLPRSFAFFAKGLP